MPKNLIFKKDKRYKFYSLNASIKFLIHDFMTIYQTKEKMRF